MTQENQYSRTDYLITQPYQTPPSDSGDTGVTVRIHAEPKENEKGGCEIFLTCKIEAPCPLTQPDSFQHQKQAAGNLFREIISNLNPSLGTDSSPETDKRTKPIFHPKLNAYSFLLTTPLTDFNTITTTIGNYLQQTYGERFKVDTSTLTLSPTEQKQNQWMEAYNRVIDELEKEGTGVRRSFIERCVNMGIIIGKMERRERSSDSPGPSR